MPSLYELSKVYQDIQTQDLTAEEIADALNAVDGMFEDKAESIAKLMRSIDSNCEVIKLEEQRLAERRKSLENKHESLKQYLQSQMMAIGKEKFKTSLFSFGIQNNPPSVNVIDEKLLSTQGYWIMQAPKLDKKTLVEDLKKGVLVAGAELQQTKSLRIK